MNDIDIFETTIDDDYRLSIRIGGCQVDLTEREARRFEAQLWERLELRRVEQERAA